MVNYKKQHAKKQRAEAKAQQKLQTPNAPTESALQITSQSCPDGMVNLQLTPIDTWFFRESRPHDAVGASVLSSLFPPSIPTLIGAVRTFLGEQIGIDWQAYKNGKGFAHQLPELDFIQAVGNHETLGELALLGPWVCKNGQRLYPTPCYLLKNEKNFTRLQIGSLVECDLGKVRLPELPENKVGYKNMEQTWVTNAGWQKLLVGDTPSNPKEENKEKTKSEKEVYNAKDLFDTEPRLGIARNNALRNVIESRLYQTQHLRLKDGVTIQLDLKNLNEKLLSKLPGTGKNILRFGGEGRMAELTKISAHPMLPKLSTDNKKLQKIIVHFITPAYFGEQDFKGRLFPPTFTKQEIDGQTVWQGELLGVHLMIEAAVIGKVHREGGWDMQAHQPRPVKSYIPAGSAWFCRLKDRMSLEDILHKLHGICVGEETAWGHGQILIGLWNDTNTQGK